MSTELCIFDSCNCQFCIILIFDGTLQISSASLHVILNAASMTGECEVGTFAMMPCSWQPSVRHDTFSLLSLPPGVNEQLNRHTKTQQNNVTRNVIKLKRK